ncbi:uroporphyrinogen decarboxylase family protein [Bacteroidota bacterium]
MNSKERFLAAIDRKILPDRLPVTTHHLMPYFLNKYMKGISELDFFDYFGLDPILWLSPVKPNTLKGDYIIEDQILSDFTGPKRICSENWRIETKKIPSNDYKTIKYTIYTPEKSLSMILQTDEYSSWVTEHLVKETSDIELIEKYSTIPICDVDKLNKLVDGFGNKGIVRGSVPSFDIYGQPGCWQDAAVLYGIQNLIIKTFEDPEWVHSFLKILCERKKTSVKSMKGAKFDIIEHGGGDASTTVISPDIFEKFVAPYDTEIIQTARKSGQRVVYHTCGGMMPILENIVAMGPDAIETFTPPDMGGDADLKDAKRRIGDKVCMIGGFDQFHFFKNCTIDQTKIAVRKCFEEAGADGGFILCPSDHFFDADLKLIMAYAEEAKMCKY